jgi:hypothetical protein
VETRVIERAESCRANEHVLDVGGQEEEAARALFASLLFDAHAVDELVDVAAKVGGQSVVLEQGALSTRLRPELYVGGEHEDGWRRARLLTQWLVFQARLDAQDLTSVAHLPRNQPLHVQVERNEKTLVVFLY